MSVSGAVLDHVAVAVEAWDDAWPRYVEDLGGSWASGGQNVGFAPAQLTYANGARLEVLQPWQPASNPFLQRFVDTHGPGPHHLTFKVPDIGSALADAESAGFSPVAVDLSDPSWMEAFLHPRQATGIVVQLAQAAGSWASPAPQGFPASRAAAQAGLHHVTHAVADLDEGLALFCGLLGGEADVLQSSSFAGRRVAELRWAGPLVLRLVAPASPDDPLHQWTGRRRGRVHHLAFDTTAAAVSAWGRPTADGLTELETAGVAGSERVLAVVSPVHNLGTRLVVLQGSDAHLASRAGAEPADR